MVFNYIAHLDLLNERPSTYHVNQKNQNHSYGSHIQRPQRNKHIIRKQLPNTAAVSNEDYISANSQIWLGPEVLYSDYDYDDISNQWDSIVQINFYSYDDVMCPICLDNPIVGRCDICGHVYCLPCLIKFLSYDGGHYKKCALCNQFLDLKRVKRATIIPRFPLKIGDTISLVLVARQKTSFFPRPVQNIEPNFPFVNSEESRYSTMAVCPKNEILTILEIEIQNLTEQLANSYSIEPENLSYIEEALLTVVTEKESQSLNNMCIFKNSNDHVIVSPQYLNSLMESNFIYYQCESGEKVFLCPLNWRCITEEFLSYDQCLPLRISSTILDLERFTVTTEFLKRYKFLDYLPLGSSVTFVELNLDDIVSKETLTKFQKRMQKKNEERRIKKKIDEELTSRKIQHENSFNTSVGFVTLTSTMKETDNVLDDDFVPLPSTSTPVPVHSIFNPNAKKTTFADMVSVKRNSQSHIVPSSSETEIDLPEGQMSRFSLSDCIVQKPFKKNKKRH